MCTLSLVRFNNQTIITSNRDDSVNRNSTEIKKINFNNLDIYYPKDQQTNGTWLAFDSTGNVAVLLNGCDKKHQKQMHHTKSRGILPIDFLKKSISLDLFKKSLDFYPFEPFTLVILKNQTLEALKWNGSNAKVEIFPKHRNQSIWSSATLYEPHIRQTRQQLFSSYFYNRPLTSAAVFKLLSSPTNDLDNGFFIEREQVRTLSTSQLILDNHSIDFIHYNHLTNQKTTLKTNISNELA